jgi:hypothetical protein
MKDKQPFGRAVRRAPAFALQADLWFFSAP